MIEVTASAAGRVNLIGEHTDYNGGYVLPAPIPQRAKVKLHSRDDDHVVVYSREIGSLAEYRLGTEAHHGEWLDYIQGCTAVLREAGHAISGVGLRIASDVPLGSGLASSAAVEIAVLRALRSAFALPIDDLELALLGQRAENEIVGAPVGAMDQIVASMGVPGAALFIDIQNLVTRVIELPASLDLVVISSGILHDHSRGDYRVRRAECEVAARSLGVATLREVTVDDLRVAKLPPPLDRRVRHVVTENARVLMAIAAIEHADLQTLGELFRASHASLRDDFAVSLPEIDELVAIADADPRIFGARLTGGGFGGSIVALAEAGSGDAAAHRIVRRYIDRTGLAARILVTGGMLQCAPS